MENKNDKFIIKLAGQAGQGIKTAGLLLSKALKRVGYKVFGYTEYPSLIRGGHNIFQIEIKNSDGISLSIETDILLALDLESIKLHYRELSAQGVIIYDENTITIPEDIIKYTKDNSINLIGIKLLDLANSVNGNVLMKNTVALGALWEVISLNLEDLKPLIKETYNKTEEIVNTNIKCIEAGSNYIKTNNIKYSVNINPDNNYSSSLLISANEAVAMSAIASGVRLYSSYPMTPASSILTYLAQEGPKFGMIVKQAEDEITAANMVIGAFHSGTRAMCATSGGGFDLMSESLSLAGMTETPFFCVIGQRPGPATGVPTWTMQSDLELAVYSGHGEYPRIVIAPSDPEQAFYLTSNALNLTEIYQTPVLMLLDKFLGESFYTTSKYNKDLINIERGKIINDNFDSNRLRYEITEDGISNRWFPQDRVNTFLANSDEHDEKGYSTENALEIEKMYKKRMRKKQTIINALPDPIIYGDSQNAKLRIVSWGSNIPIILDIINHFKKENIEISLMQIVYCYPLKNELIKNYLDTDIPTLIIEQNENFQLAGIIKKEIGVEFNYKLNKVNGRPFYNTEIIEYINNLLK